MGGGEGFQKYAITNYSTTKLMVTGHRYPEHKCTLANAIFVSVAVDYFLSFFSLW